MKSADEMGSGALTHKPSLIQIGSGIQEFTGGGGKHRERERDRMEIAYTYISVSFQQ
jgi:hypothetical protein